MHKYQPDRSIGSSWHPLVHNGSPELAIQEDETAIVIFMLNQYLLASEDEDFVSRLYHTLIQPAANFMETFIDAETSLPHASYDLWEEKFLTSTYTVAATYAGLKAAARMAEHFEYQDDAIRWQTVADEVKIAAREKLYNEKAAYFYKGYVREEDGSEIYDETIDISSLYGAVMFDLFDLKSDEVTSSLQTVETKLLGKSPSGGMPRYENDKYCERDSKYKGNPWFVSTLWLAQIYNELGRNEDVLPIVSWAQSKMMKSGVLSEQIDPETSEPVSVAPLVWSHAEFLNTLLDISN
jgi:GH15 family glucan-1,4-alpha-glucosidase